MHIVNFISLNGHLLSVDKNISLEQSQFFYHVIQPVQTIFFLNSPKISIHTPQENKYTSLQQGQRCGGSFCVKPTWQINTPSQISSKLDIYVHRVTKTQYSRSSHDNQLLLYPALTTQLPPTFIQLSLSRVLCLEAAPFITCQLGGMCSINQHVSIGGFECSCS